MRCKRKNIPSSLKMKYDALTRLDGSLDEFADDFGLSTGAKETRDFNTWYEENIFPDESRKSDFEESEPYFLCFATEGNFAYSERKRYHPRPPEGGSSGGWLNKWKNRTAVKFSRSQCARHMADDVRNVARLSKRADAAQAKIRFTQGIQTLVMALEYIEAQEKIGQQLFTDSPECQPEVSSDSSRT